MTFLERLSLANETDAASEDWEGWTFSNSRIEELHIVMCQHMAFESLGTMVEVESVSSTLRDLSVMDFSVGSPDEADASSHVPMPCMSETRKKPPATASFASIEALLRLEVGGTFAPPSFLAAFVECQRIAILTLSEANMITTDTISAFLAAHPTRCTIEIKSAGMGIPAGVQRLADFDPMCQEQNVTVRSGLHALYHVNGSASGQRLVWLHTNRFCCAALEQLA